MRLDKTNIIDNGDGDEALCNLSPNTHFADIIASQMSRRTLLRGSMSAAVLGFVAASGCASLGNGLNPVAAAVKRSGPKLVGFNAIPVSDADTVTLPAGYSHQVILPWGEGISGNRPAYMGTRNSGTDQGHQVGSHHDGMHYFPIEGKDPWQGSSEDGLLVMNHEYVEPRFMHTSAINKTMSRSEVPVMANGRRDPDEVLKEINGHGVSIVRIRKNSDGQWAQVADNRNRRITGLTEMELSGPVRGSDFVKTKFSPEGTRTRGTLNNCAHGVTPWNTYLTAEENWAGYFINHGERPREQTRYGVRNQGASRYGWELAANNADEFIRFDVTAKGSDASQDYRNEANTFGWIVEIDPFDPSSRPVKRTAMGRFAHEGVVFQPPVEGQPVVAYSGDDARNEYIYKYVSAQPYFKNTAGGHLLDNGTLYVAKYSNNGTGEWLPLVFGQGPLTPNNGFNSQADVLVNTRLAADLLGATKMDRPEWGAVDPANGLVYFTLTNNTRRTLENVDGANPRANNRWGQIVRWRERDDQPTAKAFDWDLFIMAGPTDDSEYAGAALTDENMFNSPDGLWFDHDSRLWIQTDISESVMNTGDFAQFGNNQMLACDPVNQDLKRFLVGPIGQEITGVVTTPDGKTMFVNLQHPGATTSPEDFAAGRLSSRWPNAQDAYPRSATLVITKDDGGIIGS